MRIPEKAVNFLKNYSEIFRKMGRIRPRIPTGPWEGPHAVRCSGGWAGAASLCGEKERGCTRVSTRDHRTAPSSGPRSKRNRPEVEEGGRPLSEETERVWSFRGAVQLKVSII